MNNQLNNLNPNILSNINSEKYISEFSSYISWLIVTFYYLINDEFFHWTDMHGSYLVFLTFLYPKYNTIAGKEDERNNGVRNELMISRKNMYY